MADRHTKVSETVRSGAVDLESDVARLARSVAEIETTLRNAEAEITGEAYERIRTLRSEAKQQLAVLRDRHRAATRIVSRLAEASEDSWGELRREARLAVSEARAVADAMIARFRRTDPD